MSTELIINPRLRNTIDHFTNDISHAILLTGPSGAGKNSLLYFVAKELASKTTNSKVFHIAPLEDKRTIGIDQIKDIKKMLRTKDSANRIFVIPDADIMTVEAQNSLLKILEEPPQNVIFLFSSARPQKMLITVRSRVITWKYLKPTTAQVEELATSYKLTSAEIAKYSSISRGRMGVLASLLKGDAKHVILQNIELAKDILGEPPKDRLTRVDALLKDTSKLEQLLDAMILICEAAMNGSVKKGVNYNQWLHRIKVLTDTLDKLEKHILPKLLLTKLFLVL